MKVANPIYDVVFKYLMEDQKVARILLSKIIDRDIESLDFKPTEFEKRIGPVNFTVFRIDFAATINNADGSKQLVLIEIQKAKFPTDIMRFRKYIGGHYQDKKNSFIDPKSNRRKALPIISLYFLGHKLEHTDSPVIKVKRKYIDAVTQKELLKKEEFIESLTHDSFVIQIPYLKQRRRNHLEILLSIFDQSLQIPDSKHFLDVNEDDYPEEFRVIIRRLLKAAAEEEVCQSMDVEDEILDELESYERKIHEQIKALEDKDKVIEDKDNALERAISAFVNSGMSRDVAEKILMGNN